MAENPLLAATELPLFDAIKPEHVEPAVREVLDRNRTELDALLDSAGYEKVVDSEAH